MSSPAATEPPDAVEAPVSTASGPQSEVLVYRTGHRPVVQVKIGGI